MAAQADVTVVDVMEAEAVKVDLAVAEAAEDLVDTDVQAEVDQVEAAMVAEVVMANLEVEEVATAHVVHHQKEDIKETDDCSC